MQEHATEVSGLIELAYADLSRHHRKELALETFSQSLGNVYLQRHFLTNQATSLEQAVKVRNDFLQV
mgnify:CR=1 FL=1